MHTELRPPRRAIRCPVILRCDLVTRHWDYPIVHHATDISASGMLVPTPAQLDVGDTVLVSFSLPCAVPARRVDVFARVARVDGNAGAVALEFLDLDLADADELDQFATTVGGSATEALYAPD